jgi:hypothetical protein
MSSIERGAAARFEGHAARGPVAELSCQGMTTGASGSGFQTELPTEGRRRLCSLSRSEPLRLGDRHGRRAVGAQLR